MQPLLLRASFHDLCNRGRKTKDSHGLLQPQPESDTHHFHLQLIDRNLSPVLPTYKGGGRLKKLQFWYVKKGSRINPCLHLHGQLIYDKRERNLHWGKDSLLVNDVRKPGQLRAKDWNWTTVPHHTKKKLEMDQRHKSKTWNHKTRKRRHRQKTVAGMSP